MANKRAWDFLQLYLIYQIPFVFFQPSQNGYSQLDNILSKKERSEADKWGLDRDLKYEEFVLVRGEAENWNEFRVLEVIFQVRVGVLPPMCISNEGIDE